jgi:hypothetical protein
MVGGVGAERRMVLNELLRLTVADGTGDNQGLDRRRLSLARRLDDGYRRIDQAITTGADVSAWESFWIDLLREYEAVCDELREAA